MSDLPRRLGATLDEAFQRHRAGRRPAPTDCPPSPRTQTADGPGGEHRGAEDATLPDLTEADAPPGHDDPAVWAVWENIRRRKARRAAQMTAEAARKDALPDCIEDGCKEPVQEGYPRCGQHGITYQQGSPRHRELLRCRQSARQVLLDNGPERVAPEFVVAPEPSPRCPAAARLAAETNVPMGCTETVEEIIRLAGPRRDGLGTVVEDDTGDEWREDHRGPHPDTDAETLGNLVRSIDERCECHQPSPEPLARTKATTSLEAALQTPLARVAMAAVSEARRPPVRLPEKPFAGLPALWKPAGPESEGGLRHMLPDGNKVPDPHAPVTDLDITKSYTHPIELLASLYDQTRRRHAGRGAPPELHILIAALSRLSGGHRDGRILRAEVSAIEVASWINPDPKWLHHRDRQERFWETLIRLDQLRVPLNLDGQGLKMWRVCAVDSPSTALPYGTVALRMVIPASAKTGPRLQWDRLDAARPSNAVAWRVELSASVLLDMVSTGGIPAPASSWQGRFAPGLTPVHLAILAGFDPRPGPNRARNLDTAMGAWGELANSGRIDLVEDGKYWRVAGPPL